MNFVFYEHHREDIPASLRRLAFKLVRLRLSLVRKLGWRGLMWLNQHRALLRDVLRRLLLVRFHRAKLRESRLVRMVVNSGRAEHSKC